MQDHPVIKLIQQSNYLPEIPREFGETLCMLLEPYEFFIDECIGKLSRIPNLELTLIQALNYNSKLGREIVDLKDAVLYLGAKNTRMIAIVYITRLLLPSRNGRAKIFDKKKYWKHCIGTSIASYMIAAETGLCDKEKIFTYGLIHDIGTTVLDICLPEYLDKIYTMQKEKRLHQIVAEKVVLGGLTHAEIGMWLCEKWGLPREIVEIVGYHHTPFKQSDTSNEVKIMFLADFICASFYEKLLGDEETFILYSNKVREELNLSEEFILHVAKRMPEEVEKISRNRFLDFL